MNTPCHSSAPLIIPTCRHILDTGSHCRCAAYRGRAYCRHHLDSVTRRHKMARARRRHFPFWLPPLMAARTFRDRSNCLQIALESGDLDFPTAATLLRGLRMRDAVDRDAARMGKLRETPKSFRLYQVPASSLFLQSCTLNAVQVAENTARVEGTYTNHTAQHERSGGPKQRCNSGEYLKL